MSIKRNGRFISHKDREKKEVVGDTPDKSGTTPTPTISELVDPPQHVARAMAMATTH
jgi:hypothetical protein